MQLHGRLGEDTGVSQRVEYETCIRPQYSSLQLINYEELAADRLMPQGFTGGTGC